MIDRSFTYVRHTDQELSDCLLSIDSAQHPLNTKNLAKEIERRWRHTKDEVSQKRTSGAIAKGARYEELDGLAARRFFWPYFGYGILLSFGAMLVALVFTIVLIIGFAIVVAFIDGGRPLVRQFVQYAYPLSMLILAVPYAQYFIRKITARTFGGYALRIMHPETEVLSNKRLQDDAGNPRA